MDIKRDEPIEDKDYEFVELPSRGECYSHKKRFIPLRYMTASDENLLVSKNLWQNNSIGDELLKRLILDDEIKISELCFGDRETLLLNVYRMAYGNTYMANSSENVDLSSIKAKPFYLTADNDGYFDYVTTDRTLKYQYLTFAQLKELNSKNYDSDIDFFKEYLNLSLKEGCPPEMGETEIASAYHFITYTAPGLDTELPIGESLFIKFE